MGGSEWMSLERQKRRGHHEAFGFCFERVGKPSGGLEQDNDMMFSRIILAPMAKENSVTHMMITNFTEKELRHREVK